MTHNEKQVKVLDGIEDAIKQVNRLWYLLDKNDDEQFSQRQKLLAERDRLQRQFDQLLAGMMNETTEELDKAIAELTAASQKAVEAKASIDGVVGKVEKVTETIATVVKAAAAVADVIT